MHLGQIQRAAPCTFDEELRFRLPNPVESQTAGNSGCRESPAENMGSIKMQAKIFPSSHRLVQPDFPPFLITFITNEL